MSIPQHQEKYALPSRFTAEGILEYMRSEGRGPEFDPPEAVIFTWQRSLTDYVKKKYAPESRWFFGNELLILPGTGLALVGNFGIGAPVSVTLLEELIAFGVQRFACLGTAGTLQPDIGIGDLIVCDSAVRDEGTSYHYLPADQPAEADPDLVAQAENALSARGWSYYKGSAWTTDAPFRETQAEIDAYASDGVLVVEMEAAAMFAVASFRQVPLFSMFSVSDCLAGKEWKPAFGSRKTRRGLENLWEIALAVLVRNTLVRNKQDDRDN